MGSGGSYFFFFAAGREREHIFFYNTKIVFMVSDVCWLPAAL
jgi:hypothetical protein